jgi:tetratricopeptide (TPR) repeat protein
MVGIEDLLKRVQQAETETERQWILLELQMSQMSEDLVAMLWAAAIPHFFDANILAALRPELAEQAERLYENLKSLTFVEEFPNQGYNLHELTRNVLLNKLWQDDREKFLMLSQRAADYFLEEKTSSEKDVEFCYHEILNEGKAQTGRLLDRVTDWWNDYQVDRMQAALQGVLEHERADRLDSFGKGFSLHLQGLTEIRSGNYTEAESLFIRTESFYKNIELKNPRYLTTLLRDLGSSKQNQGDYNSSIPFYEKALTISEEQLGENHSDTAISLNNLGSAYKIKGEYEKAKPLYLRSLKIREEQLGENRLDTATALNNLAGLYKDQEKYEEAKPLYLRARQIREEQLGENHLDTATSLNNLAVLYHSQGKYEEAKPLCLRALKIREEQLGENHPDTASSLNNLAALYNSQGKYEEAKSLYLRALKICEEQLGENHPKTATSLNNLASLYQEQKRYSDVIPLLERWKNIKRERKETQNREYVNRSRILAQSYEKCKQFPEAVKNYEEALSIFNRFFRSNDKSINVLQVELNRLKKSMEKSKRKS